MRSRICQCLSLSKWKSCSNNYQQVILKSTSGTRSTMLWTKSSKNILQSQTVTLKTKRRIWLNFARTAVIWQLNLPTTSKCLERRRSEQTGSRSYTKSRMLLTVPLCSRPSALKASFWSMNRNMGLLIYLGSMSL